MNKLLSQSVSELAREKMLRYAPQPYGTTALPRAVILFFKKCISGSRHTKGGGTKDVVILKIDALQMRTQGLKFFCSENGVWLTESVPPQFISVGNA